MPSRPRRRKENWKHEVMLWRGAWLALKVQLAQIPQDRTVRQIEEVVTSLGNRVLDESGLVPRTTRTTRGGRA